MLFIDLIKHYADILPKTIARKKRESLERPMPIRKRTKMVDQRLSRSRISYGADPQQLLAAQHAAQHGPPSRAARPARAPEPQAQPRSPPPGPSGPAAPEAPKLQEPEAPPAPTPAPYESYVAPPRPVFAEPAPSVDDYKPPPRPTFIEPDNEANDEGGVVVSLPTPTKAQSLVGATAPPEDTTASPVKSDEEKALVGKASLARSGSGEAASRVRGPRVPRSTGAARGGSATSPVAAPGSSSLARGTGPRLTHSRGPSSVSERAKEYAPKKNVGKANAALFSRRTQASDAEDNVMDK